MDGKIIIPPKFESIYSLHGNVALAKQNGLYGIVNKSGTFIAPPQFDMADDFIHAHATARRRHAWIRRPAIRLFAFGSKTINRAALAKACVKPIGGALGGEIGIGALRFVIEASRASRNGQAGGDFIAALRGRAFAAGSSNRALARRSDARARCARAHGPRAHGACAGREIAAEFGDLIATVAAFFHGIAIHRCNGRAALLKKAERILAVRAFGNGEAFLNANDLARAAR